MMGGYAPYAFATDMPMYQGYADPGYALSVTTVGAMQTPTLPGPAWRTRPALTTGGGQNYDTMAAGFNTAGSDFLTDGGGSDFGQWQRFRRRSDFGGGGDFGGGDSGGGGGDF